MVVMVLESPTADIHAGTREREVVTRRMIRVKLCGAFS